MSRLNSKLVLKALELPVNATTQMFEIVKSVNTLDHGTPGDQLERKTVDKILKSAEGRGARGTLTVEFIK